MSISLVQACVAGKDNSDTASTATFPANVTAGNLIVVGVALYPSTKTVTVTDSLGNTYTQAGSYINSAGTVTRVAIFYAQNVSGGACAVTVTPSGSGVAAFLTATAAEYAGALTSSVLDSTASNTGTSATATTGSVSVAGAGGLVFAVFGATAIFNPIAAVAGTIVGSRSAGSSGMTAHLQSGVSASVSAYLGSTVSWCAIGASFKPVSGGAGGGGSIIGSGIIMPGRSF